MAQEIKPVIILIKPQLGENIGTAARAMYNGGLTELRLVQPKMGWPNEHAIKPAAGATCVIENAKVFDSTEEAIADLQFVLATTARGRDMIKRIYTPRKAAEKMREAYQQNQRVGILFGPERTGLHNDDIALADAIITAPLNPDYTSLNLAQAVLLISYEWFQTQENFAADILSKGDRPLAKKTELIDLFMQLEYELDRSGFFRVKHKRDVMARNLRNMFLRAHLTSQEVRTLRGVISDLVDPYYPDRSGTTCAFREDDEADCS